MGHRMIEEFLELVGIDAPSGNERRMADALKSKLVALGCSVSETAPPADGNTGNLLAVYPGTGTGSVLFSAHMDRVPRGLGIRPRIADGEITSGGDTILAADDVAGICAILEGLRQARTTQTARLEILFTVSEEAGLLGSAAFDASLLQAEYGYVFDSSGPVGRVIQAAPYGAALSVSVYGLAAHAGNEPEAGVNALKVLSRILATIQDGRLDEESTANFSVIRAGEATNVVCAYARADGEVRSHSREKLDAYIAYLHRHSTACVEQTKARVSCTAALKYPGFLVPTHDPCVEKVLHACTILGIRAYTQRGGGGMDANHLNARGIPCVGLGTGYYKNHTTEEKLLVAEFLKAGELAATLMRAE